MAKNTVIGTCHLCGVEGELSYEHVPPQAAFNDKRVVAASMADLLASSGGWKGWDGKRGEQRQRGGGAYTFCAGPNGCNTKTGNWYGRAYQDFAQQAALILRHVPHGAAVDVVIKGMRPLQILKQVVCMFFSINGPDFRNFHPDLVRFVLDSEDRYLSPRYDVYCTLVRGTRARIAGISGTIDRGRPEVLTEVAHPPLAMVLTVDSPRYNKIGCISHFAKYRHRQVVEISMFVEAGAVETPFPGDYRKLAA